MIKVMTVFGTRPEAIKMCPVIKELKQDSAFNTIVTVTAQHRQMLDQVLAAFQVTPDYDLDIMKARQSLADITCNVMTNLDTIIKKERPDVLLVHGDTTTTMAASLTAFYNKITLGHVEAGLRTYDKYSPFPEEINRKITGTIADLHFCPTARAKENLLKEGVPEHKIFVTGNTVIDALKSTTNVPFQHPIFTTLATLEKETAKKQQLILLTTHRRENLGENIANIFKAVQQLIHEFPQLHVVYPVHLNPVIQDLAKHMLSGHPRIHLIPPLDVVGFHHFESKADLILTDSGGVQEEAPHWGVPVLVLRDRTERPEGVEAGTLQLIGTKQAAIVDHVRALLTNHDLYQHMARAKNPFGDGHASERIAAILKKTAANLV